MPKTELPQEIFYDEDALALRTFERNREQLIKFHEELAAVGKERHIPNDLREDAQTSIREFLRLRITIEEEIESLSKKRIKSGPELDLIVARLSLALYLFERTREMHNAVMAKDSLSVYALFASVRNEIGKILSAEFFKKSTNGIITDYLRIEAIFVACNKVCELETITIADAIKRYKVELRNEMIKAMTRKS